MLSGVFYIKTGDFEFKRYNMVTELGLKSILGGPERLVETLLVSSDTTIPSRDVTTLRDVLVSTERVSSEDSTHYFKFNYRGRVGSFGILTSDGVLFSVANIELQLEGNTEVYYTLNLSIPSTKDVEVFPKSGDNSPLSVEPILYANDKPLGVVTLDGYKLTGVVEKSKLKGIDSISSVTFKTNKADIKVRTDYHDVSRGFEVTLSLRTS